MAHFALIENNQVRQVIAVDNDDVDNLDFPESELVGQAFLASKDIEGNWLQTSYNNYFRGTYAGIGFTYDPDLDEFIAPIIKEETA